MEILYLLVPLSLAAVFVIGAFPAVASAGVAPKPIGGIDCNGLSPIQARPTRPTAVGSQHVHAELPHAADEPG